MTYPSEPARGGVPPWAKWTMIGCAGCLTLVILSMVGCGVWFWRFFKPQLIDVSGKPDLPLTATAGQLLPPRVGSFVRKRAARFSSTSRGAPVGGWQGSYLSAPGGKRVELMVVPTASAQAARGQGSPFGGTLPQRQQSPNVGVHMTMKVGPRPVDMVVWSKPNWTFTIQSPDMVAMQFANAYQPAVRR